MEIQNTAILLVVAAAFFTTIALVPLAKIIAQKFRFVSKIDFRRRELAPRPLLGGVAIFGGVALANSFQFASGSFPWPLILPGLGLTVLGMVDDRLQIKARIKMLFEIACVALWLYLIPTDELLLVRIGMNPVLAYACHAFWVVGLVNAFNMIDGMDGLASGMAAIGFAFLGWFLLPNPAMAAFAWSISASCLGHWLFNRPPASIFLGDSGSLLLGFWLSALGSQFHPVEVCKASVLVPLFVLAHPEIDAILAMFRRARNRTPLMQGDRDHIHHKLRRIGLGTKASLGVAYFATAFCGFTAVVINEIQGSSWTMTLTAILSITAMSTFLGSIYFMEHRLGTQFSKIGTPMLHRDIKVSNDPAQPKQPYQAVVFDLLPYYKELQERGLSELSGFINEFSAWFNGAFKENEQIIPAGSFSIIVLTSGRLDEDAIVNSFKSIVVSHDLLKNSVGIPWGLEFFLDPAATKEFEQKFGIFLRSQRIEPDQKRAA